MKNYKRIKIATIIFISLVIVFSALMYFFHCVFSFFIILILSCVMAFLIIHYTKKGITEFNTLYNRAYYDSLTGIPNRLSVDSYCEHYESEKDVSAAFIDLDNLKIINDTYGHSAGDRIIKDFASMFYDIASKYGLASRNGGDEFLAIFTGKNAEQNMTVFCRKLASAIAHYNISADYKIVYSIGCANRSETSNFVPISQLISLADQRMYEQKLTKTTLKETSDHEKKLYPK